MSSTFKQKIIGGMPISVPNQIVESGESFYISFNDHDISIYGCETTAIVLENPTVFLILNGDHRQKLKGKNKKESCEYFHQNSKLKNKMSDPDENYRLPLFKTN
jgi:hypothetical protein